MSIVFVQKNNFSTKICVQNTEQVVCSVFYERFYKNWRPIQMGRRVDYLLLRSSVSIEERQILEECDVISVCSFTFSENCELAYSLSSYSLYKLLESGY